MIQRIVLFKLKDEYCNEASRTEIGTKTLAMLKGLPDVIDAYVGLPSDEESTKSWDLSLVVSFESMEAVKAYGVDAVHSKHVKEYMLPRAEVRKAWNFELL